MKRVPWVPGEKTRVPSLSGEETCVPSLSGEETCVLSLPYVESIHVPTYTYVGCVGTHAFHVKGRMYRNSCFLLKFAMCKKHV